VLVAQRITEVYNMQLVGSRLLFIWFLLFKACIKSWNQLRKFWEL